ncbi:MAG TPA: hypothetical protein PK239_09040 [Chitinophagales bacterium]|mgnify:CR=1 FL=1|nr:hypothetical protein [Chitinophagales bacterium]HRK27421.1 hypothetical protein [Chitinophagales bacterium]
MQPLIAASYNRLSVLLCCLLVALSGAASPQFNWNSNCQNAYQRIMSLQLNEGRKLLAQEKKIHPDNRLCLLLENYADALTIFINEEPDEFARLETNKDKRLSAIEQAPNKNSPYYLYAQAEINIQWALVRLKFEQYFKAFREIQKAYNLLLENRRLYPNFYPNLKSLGAIHAIMGTIPDQYKWGIKLLGLQGNLQQGIAEIDQFLQKGLENDQLFREEGLIIKSFFTLLLQANPQKAWETAAKLPTDSHLLNCFTAATIALKTEHNEEALVILQNKPTAGGYATFWYLDYLMGTCKLNRLDPDADVPLLKFVNNFKGQNYLKDACLKLAWFYQLHNQPDKSAYYLQLAKTKGKAFIDPDKQALAAALNNELPHPILLKARLLYDGGYYRQALNTLNQTSPELLANKSHLLEFNYRKGRIYAGLNQVQNAIAFYNQTILNQQTSLPYYFAPKACIELGKIYEKQANTQLAATYYRKAMEYKNHEYKNSTEQQAKAGLNRLKK